MTWRVPAFLVLTFCCHPLAVCGEEISAEVMDGPRSLVFPQAENRLHIQKELLKLLMGGK